MPRPEKVAVVEKVRDELSGNPATLLTEYRGLTVPELAELRNQLREAGARYVIVKNTLARIAAREAGFEELETMFVGPTALTICEEDPVGPAKALRKFAKEHPELVVKGGILEGRIVDKETAEKLADLESREELLSKLAGMMYAMLANTASLFQAPIAQMARLIAALEEKGEAPAGEPPAETDEAPATADEPDAEADEPEAEADEAEAETSESEDSEPEAAETGKTETDAGDDEAEVEEADASAEAEESAESDEAAAEEEVPEADTEADEPEAAVDDDESAAGGVAGAVETVTETAASVVESAGGAVAGAVETTAETAGDVIETAGETVASAAEAVTGDDETSDDETEDETEEDKS